MVWSQDDPATEAVAQIDDSHTAAEPNNIGESCSKCHDKDLQQGGAETQHRSNYSVREARDTKLNGFLHYINPQEELLTFSQVIKSAACNNVIRSCAPAHLGLTLYFWKNVR